MRPSPIADALKTALLPLKGTGKAILVDNLVTSLTGQLWQDFPLSKRIDKAQQAIAERFCGLLPRSTEYPWTVDPVYMLVKCRDENGYIWLQWANRLEIARLLAES